MAKQLVYDLIAEKETQAAQFGGGRGRGRGGFGRGGDRDRRGDDFGDDRVSCQVVAFLLDWEVWWALS